MNQIPTNRPPTPRPTKPKYQGRPIRLPKKCAPPKALVIATTLTAILLVISIMVLSIALLVGPINNFDNDSGGKKKSKEQQNEQVEENNGIFTTLELPCSTPKKNYKSTGAGATIGNEIASDYAALISLTSNTAVASKGADEVIHPASMTKVMTVLVACENAKASNALLTVKQEMLDRRKALDGSGELVENASVLDPNGDVKKIPGLGKSITVEDALYLINYQSDTVACLMIAEYVAGSEAEFVKLMNQKAQEIGLTDTSFVNCTGLTEKDGRHNKTTCREMAAIMACAIQNEAARRVITSTERRLVTIYENGEKTPYRLSFFADWENKRLGGDTTVGKVEILGGKTGYENIPSACLVTYAKNQSTGEEYVCVTVGAKDAVADSSTGINNPQAATDTKAVYKNYV